MERITLMILAMIASASARYVPQNQLNEIDSSPIFNFGDGVDTIDIWPTAAKKFAVVTQGCLRIDPHLPPCDFEGRTPRHEDEGIESSSYPEFAPMDAGLAAPALPVFAAIDKFEGETEIGFEAEEVGGRTKDLNGRLTMIENDPAITIVYKLEGCLPTRLPFELPPCPIEDPSRKSLEVHKLIAFKLPGVQEALIFPEIDIKQIEMQHKRMKGKNRNRDRPVLDKSSSESELTSDENLIEPSKGLSSDEAPPTNFEEGYGRCAYHASAGHSDHVDGTKWGEDGDLQLRIIEPAKQNVYDAGDSESSFALTGGFKAEEDVASTRLEETAIGNVKGKNNAENEVHRFDASTANGEVVEVQPLPFSRVTADVAEEHFSPSQKQDSNRFVKSDQPVQNPENDDEETNREEAIEFLSLRDNDENGLHLQGTRYDIVKDLHALPFSDHGNLEGIDFTNRNDHEEIIATGKISVGTTGAAKQSSPKADDDLLTEEELEELMAQLGDLETELTYSKLLSEKSQDVVIDAVVENENLL